MGRSSAKEKKKAKNAMKVKSQKRSKFSTSNSNIIYAPKNPLFGSPTAYLYGKQAIEAKKPKKKASKKKKNSAQRSNGNFVARRGNNRGKRTFIARFPVIGAKTKAVPWMKKNNAFGKGGKSDKTEGKQQQRKIMNGAFPINEAAMNHLNSELEAFAAYVKLTPNEKRAREYLIGQIQLSCRNLFGVDDSQCQVFGSFAAQPVCIYESDIDLAIWGVVEPDSADDCGTKRESFTRQENDTDQTHLNQKKQERVLKWKALIDNATKATGEASHLESKIAEDTTTERNIESENNETPLFVLDRTGDASSLELNDRDTRSVNSDASGRDDNDCNDDDHNNDDEDSCASESESSDIDNADKLEKFWSRKRGGDPPSRNDGTVSNPIEVLDSYSKPKRNLSYHDDNSSATSDGTENNPIEIPDSCDRPSRRPRGQSLVSLSSSTTCSVVANLDESEMEVSFVVEANNQTARNKVGPTGTTRTRVVNSLYKLTRPLRSFASNMHVRRKARVPIINMVTHFGFECDIALGGHNGTDTSSYATKQLSRFKSFAILVVFLKVLLKQQGLDKPFTGGLGSYALYVLVARHIECHLALGGHDDPAEVLFAFLFRYGGVQHVNPKISQSCRTRLSQDIVIQTEDGGSADMKSCFQIENCISIFGACWRMIQKRLKAHSNQKFSILQYMIDAVKLQQGRSEFQRQAEIKLKQVLGGKIQAGNVSYSTTAMAGLPREEKKETIGDLEARELIEGYGESIETFMPVEEPSKKRKSTKSKKGKKGKRHKSDF